MADVKEKKEKKEKKVLCQLSDTRHQDRGVAACLRNRSNCKFCNLHTLWGHGAASKSLSDACHQQCHNHPIMHST